MTTVNDLIKMLSRCNGDAKVYMQPLATDKKREPKCLLVGNGTEVVITAGHTGAKAKKS